MMANVNNRRPVARMLDKTAELSGTRDEYDSAALREFSRFGGRKSRPIYFFLALAGTALTARLALRCLSRLNQDLGP